MKESRSLLVGLGKSGLPPDSNRLRRQLLRQRQPRLVPAAMAIKDFLLQGSAGILQICVGNRHGILFGKSMLHNLGIR